MAVAAWVAPTASAEVVYGLTDSGKLTTFDSSTPQATSTPITITGLTGSETLKAIDVRPATLQLYGLSDAGRLYRIDVTTGVATPIGGTQTIVGGDIDIDFNPTVDRLRIVSDGETNLRVNPNNGDPATVDGNLNPAGNVTGAAYTKNAPASSAYPNTPATTLFDIDTASDQLLTQNPPNNGTLVTPVGLGVDLVGDVGFDISTANNAADGTVGADTAYLVGRTSDGNDRLYTVNLGATSAAATAVGEIAGTDKVKDIAVAAPVPQIAVLYTPLIGAQQISTYRADRPGTALTTQAVTGLTGSDTLIGIDRRPASGAVFGVSANGSRVYTINVTTGAATLVGAAFTPAFTGVQFGVDFNPMADAGGGAAIRVVSDAAENAALNPTTGARTSQTALQYAAADVNAGQAPNVTAAGYTSATSAAPPLRLFDIDTTLDTVVEQTPFAAGTLNTIPANGPTAPDKSGTLGVAVTDDNGFDILPRFNQQLAALQPQALGGLPTLYAVNGAGTAPNAPAVPALSPANGRAVSIGTLTLPSAGSVVAGMTVTNDNVLPAAPTPTATPTPTPTTTVTASPTATATSPYTVPTATPTATVPPTTYTVKKRPGLSGKVRPKRDKKKPFKFTASGSLKRPSGVSKSAGCKGKIKITVKKGSKTVGKGSTKVKSSCKYSKKIKLNKKAGKKGKAKFSISFRGNSKLLTKTIKKTAKYGRK